MSAQLICSKNSNSEVMSRGGILFEQRGSSLIEVMVSLFVLAIGVLGILGMQAKSMQFNQSAHVYSQSIYLANDLAERIRSNSENAVEYGNATMPNATSPTPATNCSVDICTGAQLVAWDLYAWSTHLRSVLPSGRAEVTPTAFNGREYLNILLSFDDSRADENEPDENTSGRKTYQLMVEI